MIRRLFWFALGVISGIYATLWSRRKVTEIGERLTVTSILNALLDAVKFLFDKLIELLKKDANQGLVNQSTSAPGSPSQN
ncbi:MAG: hypothetical protein RIR69_1260 [Actinomycetota bacterium]